MKKLLFEIAILVFILSSCAKKPLVSSVVQVDSVTHTQTLGQYFSRKDSVYQVVQDSNVIILTFSDTAKVHIDLTAGTIDGKIKTATIIQNKKNSLNKTSKIDSAIVSTKTDSNVRIRQKTTQKQQINYTAISIGIAGVVALLAFLIFIIKKVINFYKI